MSRFSNFKKGKKAFIGDVLMLMILLFVLAIVIMVAYLVLSNVNTAFSGQSSIPAAGKAIVSDATAEYINLWDGIFVFLLVGLSLAAGISAYFIDTHPLLFVFMLIILCAYVFVSAAIANAYYDIESASAFSSFALEFKMMHFVMSKLPYYVLMEGVVIMIALFAKTNQQ